MYNINGMSGLIICGKKSKMFSGQTQSYESEFEKTYCLTFAPKSDSNQPVHPRSLFSRPQHNKKMCRIEKT